MPSGPLASLSTEPIGPPGHTQRPDGGRVHGDASPPVPRAGDRERGGIPAGGRRRGVVRAADEEAAEEGPGGAGGEQCRRRGGGVGWGAAVLRRLCVCT